MFIKFTILLTLAVASATAEAPYPAAGWRPQKAFNLPREYLPPPAERQQQPNAVNVEISKERLEFAGQIQSKTLVTNQLQKNYSPPNANYISCNHDNNFLCVQALPHQNRPHFLRKQVLSRPVVTAPQFLHKQILSRPITAPQRGDQAPFGQRIPPQQAFQPGQQQIIPKEKSNPEQQYGLPDNDNGKLNIYYPDTSQVSENDDGNDNLAAIEALNAALDEYNRREELKKNKNDNGNNVNVPTEKENGYDITPPNNSESERFSEGQYFVLGPDNTVQRVIFKTTQDDEEAKTNGFTAQLKYTPVGEIRDPIFKYNDRGQLVRILK